MTAQRVVWISMLGALLGVMVYGARVSPIQGAPVTACIVWWVFTWVVAIATIGRDQTEKG